MPEEGVATKPHADILSYEEIRRFAEAAVGAGISKVRLTGGEPLVRNDAVALVRMLAAIPGLNDMSLTTNGVLLPRYGDGLKEAGLRRVNISIDSLDPQVYRRITRRGTVDAAIAGLEKALEVGFSPIKVNAVLMRGVNDDPKEFLRLIHEYPVHIRFIEFMPIGKWDPERYLSIDEMKASIERYGTIEPVGGPAGAGPARYYSFKGALGTVGFISPVSNHFCGGCNRLRLTPDGKLRACLFSDIEFDIKARLRDGAGRENIIGYIREVIDNKPERHVASSSEELKRLMYQIGG